jgi:integrase
MAKVRKREWTNAKGDKKLAYVVDYTDAEGVRRTPQFDKKHQADAHLRKVQRELEDGVHVSKAAAVTFAFLSDGFLRDCDRRRRIKDSMTGNSFETARGIIVRHLDPKFGKMMALDITTKMVRDFINEKAEKYSHGTVSKINRYARMVLQFGVREGHLKRNVLRDDPTRVPLPPPDRVEIPTMETLKRIIGTVEGMLDSRHQRLPGARRRQLGNGPLMTAVVVYAALTAGMRRGEIGGLLWQHVDFADEAIRVEHSFSRYDGLKGPKSKAGRRTLPMVPMLKRRLLELWEACGRPAEGHVVCARCGAPLTPDAMTRQYWEPVAKAADVLRKDGGIMGLHSLRHAAASLWIKAQVPELALKAAIGHASIAFTKDVYGHLFDDDAEARRRLRGSHSSLLTIDATPAV